MATLDQQYDSSKFFLYAVNVMLQTINELPISTDVELAEILEAQVASSVLVETKKNVLSEGWDFNMDEDYNFVQDSNGFISIGANVLDITDTSGDLVVRDWKLYSKSNQTSVFTEPQTMTVKWDIDFNAIPHPIRNYITIKAARKFAERTVTDVNMSKLTADDENDAYLAARRSEGSSGQYNMLTSTYGASARSF